MSARSQPERDKLILACVVPMAPYPMPRPRAGRSKNTGRTTVYKEKEADAALAAVSRIVRAAYGCDQPAHDGPVIVDVVCVLERPKTVKRRWPGVKPDVDNYLKTYLDGITQAGKERVVPGRVGLVVCGSPWDDDGRVILATILKLYADEEGGERPHTLIKVYTVRS